MKSNPCWTTKRIEPASLRLNELALPRFPKVTETFGEHLHHMDIFLIENFLNKIYGNEYQTPEEAMTIVRQKLRDRQQQIRRQKKEAKKLRKKMCAKQTNTARNYSNYVNQSFRSYILSDQQVSLTGDAAKYSNSILNKLCRLMKQKVPKRDSCDLLGQILCKLADKIANWVVNFVENSDFKGKVKETCNFVKECVSIEDYYPREGQAICPQAPCTEEPCDEEEPCEVCDDAMSFLSHVDVDPCDCAALFDKINLYRQQRLDKLAAAARRKQFMDAKRAAAAAARLARGFGDDEEEEEEDNECYGDINEKPQWKVEWVDKSNAPCWISFQSSDENATWPVFTDASGFLTISRGINLNREIKKTWERIKKF